MLKISHNGIDYFSDNAAEFIKMGVPAAVVSAAMQAHELEQVNSARSQAYSLESDPLFIEWNYDQTPEAEQAWRAKVAEIKERYPLPPAD